MLPGRVLQISEILAASGVSLYWFHLTSLKVLPGWASLWWRESDVGFPYQHFQAPVHFLPTSCRSQAVSIVNWVQRVNRLMQITNLQPYSRKHCPSVLYLAS